MDLEPRRCREDSLQALSLTLGQDVLEEDVKESDLLSVFSTRVLIELRAEKAGERQLFKDGGKLFESLVVSHPFSDLLVRPEDESVSRRFWMERDGKKLVREV